MRRAGFVVTAVVAALAAVVVTTPTSGAPVAAQHYEVELNDTYRVIAAKLGVSEVALSCANRTSATSCPSVTGLLGVGRIIHVPATPPPTTTTTTVPATTTTVPPTTTTVPAATTTTVPAPTTTVAAVPLAPIADNFTVTNELVAGDPPRPPAGEGAFRTGCAFSHLGYNDPIVFPGQPNASHLHAFFGNTLTDSASTYTSLRTTGESTCAGGKLNRSGYWVPALLDGNNQVRVFDPVTIYYKCSWTPDAECPNFRELPPGMRMIAGFNPADPTNAENPKHYNWSCRDSAGTMRAGTEGKILPTCTIGEYLYVRLEFPNCWDGVRTDSANHRDHMAYATYPNGTLACPSTHQVRLPTITVQLDWPVTGTDTSTWKLSSDTGTHGQTFHADWFGAWSPPIMTAWMGGCVTPPMDCVFSNIGPYQGSNMRLREPVPYAGSMILPQPARG